MAKKTNEQSDVDQVVSVISKQFGSGAIMNLGDEPPAPIDVIPSGALSLDAALGVGGYPRGRIVEIFGPESSGKTTLALHAIRQVQAQGGVAAFIDAEHAFDLSYAKALGIQPSKLLVSQPDHGEQALEIVDLLTRSHAVTLIVIDSVAALVPKAEIDGEMGDSHMGLHARLMSQALRKLVPAANKSNATLLFINQLRQKIGVVFGNPETTTGGNALKFYASVRLDVRRIGKVTSGDAAVGNRTRIRVVKNKCAPPFGEVEVDIRWGHGIDRVTDLIDTATQAGVLEKSGAYYAHAGKNLAQGRDRLRDVIAQDAGLEQGLTTETRAALSRTAVLRSEPVLQAA